MSLSVCYLRFVRLFFKAMKVITRHNQKKNTSKRNYK